MEISKWNQLADRLASLMAWKSRQECAAIEECMRVVGEFAKEDTKATQQPKANCIYGNEDCPKCPTVADQPVDCRRAFEAWEELFWADSKKYPSSWQAWEAAWLYTQK